MIKKLDFKLISLEFIALIFIISGIKRLYIASQGEKYDALNNEDWQKFQALTDEHIGQFFVNQAYWTFGIILGGILVVGLINWKSNIGFINSIAVFILIFGISATTGFFASGIINGYLNYFCGLFAESYGMSFLIGGLILTTIGFTILWKAIDMNKSTVHNTV